MLRSIGVIGMLALIFACAVSPTGRKQVLLFSGDQMSQMGIAAYESLQKEKQPIKDAKVNRYVSCVTDHLIKQLPAELKKVEWEVKVFDDETPNAFALPGGKIGVHTGMLNIASTQEQLAAVIGHEIGHVWANHGNERMSRTTVAQMGLQMASVLAGEPSPEKQLALGALGIATQGVVMKYDRKQEKEADGMGLDLMARAGFDPQQAVKLWQKMAEQGGARPPEFMSTHPSETTRIEKLTSQMSGVLPLYKQAVASGNKPSCKL